MSTKSASKKTSVEPAHADAKLMTRLRSSYSDHLAHATSGSAIVPEFLAALTANESGGDPHARRFEPGVYRRLKDVAEGRLSRFGSVTKQLLDKEIARAESRRREGAPGEGAADPAAAGEGPTTPASEPAQAQTGAPQKPPAAGASSATPDFADDFIRSLATSWGLTQIMGYHLIGRGDPVERLLEPAFHYQVAVQLLQEFAVRHHLNPSRDFEALFRCWNTGRPDGQTADPGYAEKGLRRLDLYRQAEKERQPGPEESATVQHA